MAYVVLTDGRSIPKGSPLIQTTELKKVTPWFRNSKDVLGVTDIVKRCHVTSREHIVNVREEEGHLRL